MFPLCCCLFSEFSLTHVGRVLHLLSEQTVMVWVQTTTWLPYSLPHLDFDPALGMMTGIPPINPMMPGLGIVPPPIPPDMPAVKEIIHCKSCTLFPPNPRNSLFMFFPVSVCLYRNTCVCVYIYLKKVYMREEPSHCPDIAALGGVPPTRCWQAGDGAIGKAISVNGLLSC